MNSALVLDARQRSALATTRSLGYHGVTVITADDTPTALAGNSKFSHHYHTYASPERYEADFIGDVKRICDTHSITMILPMTELTTNLILAHRDEFRGIIIPFPSLATVNRIADKCSLTRLASSLNIPLPRTWYIESLEHVQDELTNFPYPLVLKPGKSWLEYNGIWLHTSVRIAANIAEAFSILNSDPAFVAHPFLLQEYVPGVGQGVFALYDQGKPKGFFAHQRLREKPPRGGVSVLSKSVPPDIKLQSYAKTLLDEVKWHGVAMVEFKVSDDSINLMEINTRFWGSLQLAIDAGVDFPWLLYQIASGRSVKTVQSYRYDTRLRWLLGDIDRLYLVLKDSNFTTHDKLSAIMSFFKPAPIKTHHEVNRWSDLRPFAWELQQYIKDLFR